MLVMIEGIDGTGKTSLISELKTRDRFSEAMFVPTPSTVIRDSVLGYNIDPVAKFFFFLGDMVDIRKTLEEESAKRVVFLDRFFVSTYVYQVALGEMTPEEKSVAIQAINTFMPKFDKTFILTAKTEVAMQRSETRGIPADSFESAKIGVWERRKQVYENTCFSEISEMLGNTFVLDTTNLIADHLADIVENIIFNGR